MSGDFIRLPNERRISYELRPLGVFYAAAGVVATMLGLVILAAIATGLWMGLMR